MRHGKEAIVWCAALGMAASACGGMIQGTHGLNGLGAFSANIRYSSLDPTRAVLQIELANTTPAERGGFLTAFAWNNPGQRINGVELFHTTDPDFRMLGGPSLNNFVNGAPFGLFDFGVSTGKHWQGGGNPSRGLAPGDSSIFTFQLIGHDLDGLTDQSFSQELSAPYHDGRGTVAFAARFRGFDSCNPDSDKVPNDPPVMLYPEPNSLSLAGVGIAGLGGFLVWRRWRCVRQPSGAL